jgi:16S rRNA (adenine1518-N6/adenine1519-N6)-dimethyltransferase
MRAKKSLGQHFLTSRAVAEAIRDAADPEGDDIILEIGPGEGFLTDRLIPFTGKVVAIEKDRRLIPLLEEKYESEVRSGKLEVLERDILEFDPEVMCMYEEKYKVVANIPYYITGKIFRLFLTSRCQPSLMVVLIQKEVAERIVAKDAKESVLSLSVKAYGTPHIIRKVSRNLFKPAPNVDSAVLVIENISRDFFEENGIEEKDFFDAIKKAFGEKRKKLGSTVLKGTRGAEEWKDKRPENLPLIEWARLLKAVRN